MDGILNDPGLIPTQQARQQRMYAHFAQMTQDLGKAVDLSKKCLRLMINTQNHTWAGS